MNLLFFRIEAWLLCNDNGLQSSFPKMLNVQKDKIPDMLKEEKQSYFGPYEKTDFTKSKAVGILAALVSIAGIATMITFGVLKGTVYNEAAANAESTVLYIEARSDSSTPIPTGSVTSPISMMRPIRPAFSATSSSMGPISRTSTILSIVSETPLTAYDSETATVSRYWYYFTVTFSDHYDLDKQDLRLHDHRRIRS
jgi:hypothetical protein